MQHLPAFISKATAKIVARSRPIVCLILINMAVHAGFSQVVELRTPVAAGGHAAAQGQQLSWSLGQTVSIEFENGWIITSGVQQPNSVLIAMNIRALLDGPYQETTGLMKDGLRVHGLLPLTEPYTGLGYAHVFGGGEVLANDGLLVSGADALVDWVLLELRTPDGTVHATRCAVLQRDGDVVDMDGSSPVRFKVLPGAYHVIVRHRNHLAVMTSLPVPLGQGINSLDFVDGSVDTYGTDAQRLRGGVRLLWAGDATGDGIVQYTGAGNDRDLILFAIGGVVPTNTSMGYLPTDLDLDGTIKYTGVDNDRDIILQTVGGVVPTATRITQIP